MNREALAAEELELLIQGFVEAVADLDLHAAEQWLHAVFREAHHAA